MSGSLNEVSLIGNVGRDPEIRSTQDGRRIANLSIATSDTWKDRNSGERKERVEWHRVVIFNERLTEIVEKYVRKGSKLFVRGALQTRKWTDQAGVEKYSTEVVLQAFNGEIVLLGDAGGANRPPPADSADDYGYENTGTGSYAARHGNPGSVARGNFTTAAPLGGELGGDIDDSIPF